MDGNAAKALTTPHSRWAGATEILVAMLSSLAIAEMPSFDERVKAAPAASAVATHVIRESPDRRANAPSMTS